MGFIMVYFLIPPFTNGQNNPSGVDIIDPKSEIKEVFAGGEGLLLEGPAMAPDGT
jgi:hypothetical protein